MLSDSELVTQSTARPFVVVPSYNHARFVETCLRSVMKQTLKPLELLVIDDGSRDESPRIIENALKDCPFACELVVRANRGLSATLNEGLKRSRGSYFAYLASDDVWFPTFIESRIATLENRPNAVLAYGNAFSIDGADVIIDCTADWAAYIDGDPKRMLMSTLAPLSPTVVYRHRAVNRYGWNEKAKLEDYELYLRLSIDGEFAFDPRVLSAWRVHGQNASLNLSMMMREKLEAQSRLGPDLGFTQDELKRFQSLTMFRTAQEHMRRNEKRKAVSLMLKNLQGIQSPVEAVRMLAGLLAPQPLLRWRKSRRQEMASKRYGSIEYFS
jgi:alpha-1,3-rhamnosyltransferase